MTIKKFTVNNTEFMFVNTTWSNSRAWGHETTLLENDREVATNKCTHLNRTWECYEYQTCMLGCVRILIENRIAYLTNIYKEDRNISRITKKHREALEEIINDDARLNLLKELKGML